MPRADACFGATTKDTKPTLGSCEWSFHKLPMLASPTFGRVQVVKKGDVVGVVSV